MANVPEMRIATNKEYGYKYCYLTNMNSETIRAIKTRLNTFHIQYDEIITNNIGNKPKCKCTEIRFCDSYTTQSWFRFAIAQAEDICEWYHIYNEF